MIILSLVFSALSGEMERSLLSIASLEESLKTAVTSIPFVLNVSPSMYFVLSGGVVMVIFSRVTAART